MLPSFLAFLLCLISFVAYFHMEGDDTGYNDENFHD